MPYNAGQTSVLMNALSFAPAGEAGTITVADIKDAEISDIHDLGGHSPGTKELTSLTTGIYIVRLADGTSAKIKI